MPQRRALVTGGAGGIGSAICNALAEGGFEVIQTSRTKGTERESIFQTHAVDFGDKSDTLRFAKEVAAMEIDVLVNNAGINLVSPIAQIDPNDFERIQSVNLVAPMVLSQAVLAHMRKRRWGRIINVASIFAHVSRAQRAAYSASKFGLVGLTKAVAAEVASQGILVNCVSPGVIETELTRSVLGEAGIAQLTKEIPIGRIGHPEEVARLVRFLASDENTYISGQSIVIDGGFISV